MDVFPSISVFKDYEEISTICKKTAQPVFLTKDGEKVLVVMDIKTYNNYDKILKLKSELDAVEKDRLSEKKECSIEELEAYLDNVIASM